MGMYVWNKLIIADLAVVHHCFVNDIK